jgi:ferredoxin
MPVGTPGFTNIFDGHNHEGEAVHLEATRMLQAGEVVDLTKDNQPNYDYFTSGPGYSALNS